MLRSRFLCRSLAVVAWVSMALGAGLYSPSRPFVREARLRGRWGEQLPPQISRRRLLAFPAVLGGMHTSSVQAKTPVRSTEELFAAHCAGCHAGGGNVVFSNEAKTLSKRDLEEAGLYGREQAISKLIYFGTGYMKGLGADCAPRDRCAPWMGKLTTGETDELARYVLEQAEGGWR
mmetsp:Transcript_22078/g.40565  ORF Transcript_22078/g.40565 Transcript_22078/m.40565 type:complete len:176 (+) Transcript_22078:59-586(+)